MGRRVAEDTPAYAADALASAQINGRRLTASGGLFIVLLVAMSLVEAPVQGSDAHVLTPEDGQSATPAGSPPAHGSADTPVAQLGAKPWSKTTAGVASWCPRAPDVLT